MSWLVPQLTSLSATFPSVDIHLYFGSGPDLLLRVRTLGIDCAVTSSRFTDPKLESIRLHREDYAFVGAAALLRKQPLTNEAHAAPHPARRQRRSPPLPLLPRRPRRGRSPPFGKE